MKFMKLLLLYYIFQVRQESLKVLHLILSNSKEFKVEPFFDFISTYLRSAMTHIDNRIQEDSLLLLDILLACTPERVVKDFHKIIPNFLDMISKLRVDTKPGRTLTINLDSQTTSVKWRVKVLHRLQDFLQKFVDVHKDNSVNEPLSKSKEKFDNKKFNYYPLANENYTSNCFLPIFSTKNLELTIIDETEKLKSYIDTLMPLLLETWVEVCPTLTADKKIEMVITEDAAILLKHVLQVISLIWDLVHYLENINPSANVKTVFINSHQKSFCQHFVKPFPFVTNIRLNKSKSVSNTVLLFEDSITDPKMMAENISICHLFVRFTSNVNINNQMNEIKAVLNFIEKTFNTKTPDDINELVIQVLQTMFSQEIAGWTKNWSIMSPLFFKIIWAYFNMNLSQSFNQNIYTLLCKIALNDKLTQFHDSEPYCKWLLNLPDILLNASITMKSVDILHKFAVQNNVTFNKVLRPKLLKIVENLPKIKISDSTGDHSFQKLLSLLFWIKNWDTATLNVMEKQLLHSEYSNSNSKFIMDTLRFRSSGIYE